MLMPRVAVLLASVSSSATVKLTVRVGGAGASLLFR
jgi:hypothetical protein